MPTENLRSSPLVEPPHTPTSNSSLSSSCPTCNTRHGKNGRNLVVCIDGTSNQFGRNNTNVVKLFDAIDRETRDPEQLTYYSSGIGTRPKSSSSTLNRMWETVSDTFDMAIAWNIDENIKEAYGWLAEKYREGDRIFLFGFSRGAYQVRVLAGMIYEVGLIRTRTEKQIATAYHHYEAIRPGNPEARQIARKFKKTFSWTGLKVHFIGIWDTVSSLGITGEGVSRSMSLSASACHIRHALALDERRVKFMPEYFHETNSQIREVGMSNYLVSSLDLEHSATPVRERSKSIASSSVTSLAGTKEGRVADIKEVWFAGSHSDVGGRDRTGKFHQVGNVSLLWMRREAAVHGLVLQPTDIVWGPDDIDFGISNSMSLAWRLVEYLAIKHRVSFTGAGDDARRMHRLEPRHIMPGQKVHASILYANAYKPHATWGGGYDIPMIYTSFKESDLDDQLWETDLFGDTEAKDLVTMLSGQRGVPGVYLDKIMFMLRFKEGRECVRKVPEWQDKFKKVICNRDCVPLVRLVTILAYYEVSCDPEPQQPQSPNPANVDLSKDIFDDMKRFLHVILATHKHRDGSRILALLSPLAKHQTLRQGILTKDVLEALVNLIDVIVEHPERNFAWAMNALNSLLQYDDTRETIIGMLGADYPNSSVSRLSRILEINDPYILTLVLRMMLTLVKIPEANAMCFVVKPRLRELTTKHGKIIGPLAFDLLLLLHIPHEAIKVNIRDATVRQNFASALVRKSFAGLSSPEKRGLRGEKELRCLFELKEGVLSPQKKMLIDELKNVVEKGNARGRTAATGTLLKLCEAPIVREYLRGLGLLDIFVSQLQTKETAMLAAYAIAVCLSYNDMWESIEWNERLPKYIVGMLRLDYFDDAMGQIEGFQIFGNLMQYARLREKIKDYDITEVLAAKLGKGEPKEIRTSLTYLEIFWSFDHNCPWTGELVARGLEYLRNPAWKVQKSGVTILSALAQTKRGVEAICPCIPKIFEMFIPCPSTVGDARSPSWMMGPACALRNLAQNKILRGVARETTQYASLKSSYLSETLISRKDTSPWHVKTPNRADVIDMLDKVIKAIDEELLSEEGLVSIGDALPPRIRHWDRLGSLVRNRVLPIIALPPLLGITAVVILGVAAYAPIHLSIQAYESIQRRLSRYRNGRILDSLYRGSRNRVSRAEHGDTTGSKAHREEVTLVEYSCEGSPDGASADAQMGQGYSFGDTR